MSKTSLSAFVTIVLNVAWYFVAIALVLTTCLPRMRAAFHRRSVLEFYLLAAFVMWMFALGPDPTAATQSAAPKDR